MESLERLRALVSDSIGKHMYANAIFFADKLVSMSDGDPDDVYRLAQGYYYTKQHRRALHLLRAHGLAELSVRCCFLAARCLLEARAFDECLATIARGVELARTSEHASQQPGDSHGPDGRISSLAALYFLAGRVHDAQDHRSLAAKSYAQAAREDVYCFEAIDALVSRRMLSAEQRAGLLAEIVSRVPAADEWLALYYRARLDDSEALRLTAATVKAAALEPALACDAPFAARPLAGVDAEREFSLGRCGGRAAAGAAGGVRDAAGAGAERAAGVGGKRGHALPSQRALHGLAANADLLSVVAEAEYDRANYAVAHALTSRVLRIDPFELSCVAVHCCALYQLRLKPELFAIAHRLVDAYPQRAEAWFAAGVYSQLLGEHEAARSHFSKATALQSHFVPAWVGYAHSFAAQDESDQAMAAYRAATRLFAGSPLPWLGIGMEYLRTNHLSLAEQFIRQALSLAPESALVLHELGVVHYLKGEYEAAITVFERVAVEAAHVVPPSAAEAREPSLVNLGHSYRKLSRFDDAVRCYESALAVCPRSASTYAALAFTFHLAGDSHRAITHYHQALALRPDDTFTAEMLSRALEEALQPEALELMSLPSAQPLDIAGLEETADMEMAH